MTKIFISFALLAGIIGTGVTPAMPTSAAMAQTTLNTSGQFSGAGRKTGDGTVTLVRNADGSATLTFQDFKVSRGPDLRVWLSDADTIIKSRDVKQSQYVEISKLKSSKGDQSYVIPASALAQGLDQVVIWCKPFGVLFASAKLN
ncbi:DM13 domain-containing protein [Parasphingorhabdus sp.]|jgi:hypothetical protein|uniref:DM13 domain-containing protein n=1 Tax=Parasphingorhabdus sp. TaxID=2709688 RepID=UPI003D2CF223